MMRLASIAGSTRWTPWLIAALVGGAIASSDDPGAPAWLLVAPMTALALNLAAAIVANRRFHGRRGLLLFHVGLLACAVLVALGRMVVLDGRVEIPVGQRFERAALEIVRRGPWHPVAWLDAIRFEQGRFAVTYEPGLVRTGTRTTIRTPDERTGDAVGGATLAAGDTTPFRLGGYRLHSTSNKGFAALVTWMPRSGEAPTTGYVHLPSFPLYDWRQIAEWTTPGGDPLELEVAVPVRARRDAVWTFDSDLARRGGALTVRTPRGEVAQLRPGGFVTLAGGVLRYEGLAAWIGYRVSYDATLPWLLASALVGLVGLGWHLLAGFGRPHASGHGARPGLPPWGARAS
jgi:cytochrome c biogenesis protein